MPDRRTGARAEQKRRWDRENRPRCGCGQPMAPRSAMCSDCDQAARAAYRRMIEEMWAEGMTSRQIATALGWTMPHPGPHISTLRARGYNLPHRRTPEQVARIVAGNDARLAKARAAYRAQRAAA